MTSYFLLIVASGQSDRFLCFLTAQFTSLQLPTRSFHTARLKTVKAPWAVLEENIAGGGAMPKSWRPILIVALKIIAK